MVGQATRGQAFTLETRVGRLVEARVSGLRTEGDVADYAAAFASHLLTVPAKVRPILCADHRPVNIYPQVVAERLVELFINMNSRLERVAIIAAPSNATFVLQIDRIVRTAGYAARKVFYAVEDSVHHLAPLLKAEELTRLRAFLDEYPPV